MRWFLFSQTNIAPPLIPVINRGNQEQAGERSGHENLPMPGSWEMGTAGKGTTAPCMAQKGPRDFLGGNPPGKATGPKQRRGLTPPASRAWSEQAVQGFVPMSLRLGSSTKVEHTPWDSSPVYQWHHFVTGMQVQQTLELIICWQWLLWEPIMWWRGDLSISIFNHDMNCPHKLGLDPVCLQGFSFGQQLCLHEWTPVSPPKTSQFIGLEGMKEKKKGKEYFFSIGNTWYFCYFITMEIALGFYKNSGDLLLKTDNTTPHHHIKKGRKEWGKENL